MLQTRVPKAHVKTQANPRHLSVLPFDSCLLVNAAVPACPRGPDWFGQPSRNSPGKRYSGVAAGVIVRPLAGPPLSEAVEALGYRVLSEHRGAGLSSGLWLDAFSSALSSDG